MKRKKGKKKIWYRTWMGYCPTELKDGLGAQAGRAARMHGAGGMGSRARARGERALGAQGERARGAHAASGL